MSAATLTGELRPLYVAEPPPAWRVLPPLVADCSLVAALLFQENERDDALARMQDKRLHAPDLLTYEIMSVAAKKHRLGLATSAAEALAQYEGMPITLHAINASAVLALALRYQLSTYDAAYLWLADQLKAPLGTFDRRLGAAAQTHLGGTA
jgi:predicted nucleic acid-binding protein